MFYANFVVKPEEITPKTTSDYPLQSLGDITPQTLLKTSMKTTNTGSIRSSPQTFNRCYHIGQLLRLGLLPAVSDRAFQCKGSSQQNCNLPILLRLCKSGSNDYVVHSMYISAVLPSQEV